MTIENVSFQQVLSKREYKGRIWYKDEGIWRPETYEEEVRRAAEEERKAAAGDLALDSHE